MAYCTVCGQNHHAEEEEAQAAIDREVEMERLRTKRDIEVAKIQAGQWKAETETMAEADVKVAEIEAESGVVAAEAVADAVTDILAPEPEPVPEPVIITYSPEPEPEPTIEPVESEPPKAKKSDWSYW